MVDRLPPMLRWIVLRGSTFWIFALAIVGVLLLLAAARVDSRLGSIEDRLQYRPPEELHASFSPDDAAELDDQSPARLAYVPVYSHVFRHGGAPFLLAATVSVRNTDPARPLVVRSAAYHDTAGKLVREYLSKPLTLAPLSSTAFFVEQDDVAGGVGASFLVRFSQPAGLSEPLFEAVMLGTIGGQQVVSFSSRGVVLEGAAPQQK